MSEGPLDVRGTSVAVSAGAGCGKTTVLTRRFLGALEGKVHPRLPLRSLVALTFTEKAARELRKRIREACHDRLDDPKEAEPAYWRSVLRGLEGASVGTFHEYCAARLREHPLRAGIDPDFQVLDEAIAGALRDAALDRCIRRWLVEPEGDLIELAVAFGLRTVREAIDDLVADRNATELAAWAGKTEEELLAVWKEHWERVGRGLLIAPVLEEARACARWLEANELDHAKLKAYRAELLGALAGMGAGASTERLKEVRALSLLPRGVRVQQWPSEEVKEEGSGVIKAFRDRLDGFLKKAEPDEAASLRAAGHGLRLARLATEARGEYEAAKRARGGLDFDDLIAKALKLLREDPAAVRGEEGEKAAFVMVDEFQDTDPVQGELLRRLCGEGFAGGGLFLVGDTKQSIYRFRGAQPRLFGEFRAAFPEAGRHELAVNYRSAAGVIDFVNALFAEAFEGEEPRLLPGPGATPAHEGPAVEFLWAEEPAEEGVEGKGRGPSVAERRRVEARWLARRLRERLEAGWMIRDRERGGDATRKAEAGDVAFLFRAMTDLAAYEHALQAEGFDFHVVGGKAFYAQQEVQDLVNVLSVVEDPLDAASLAGALRGPFFGLSDDALFWLGGPPGRDLPAGLAAAEEHPELDGEDRRRARRANELLGRWRGMKDRVPIATMVDRVLDESGFEAALLGEFLGERKRANARKLVRLAARFDARGGFTLGPFVAKLRADLRRPPREEQASTTEEGGRSVRLMSIHQSKGLEFPIVVVPDLNRKQEPPGRSVAFDPVLGPLVRPGETEDEDGDADDAEGSGRSLGWVTFEAVEKREEDEEAVRLFYVAATRARDALILSAGANAGAKPISAALRLLDSRFDRRTGELVARLPGDWSLPRVSVVNEAPQVIKKETRPKRTSLRAVARVITSATLRPESEPERIVWRPRFVNLDEARGLSTHGGRLDRLVRSILAAVPRFPCRDGDLPGLARLAARKQDPVAHGGLVEEAVELLWPWLEGPFGEQLGEAGSIERGVVWGMGWPADHEEGTWFSGRTDLVAVDGDGGRCVVTFSVPGADEAVERLRALLGCRVARERGTGPIVGAWRIKLGERVLEERLDVEPIDEAVAAALSALGGGGGVGGVAG